MTYLIFGFAIGTFICGLIEHFHKPVESGWIQSKYLFLLSGIGFLFFIYTAWPLLKQLFG